ncbi:MAG TPA: signal peptidase II [Jatrophihabitans sp.]|uniref:signal peptidase II n=1 Tax=Jatrophihabitans sp. TaxID=1932789 RepID=UPI002EDC9E66
MSNPRSADSAHLAGRSPVRKTWLFFLTALVALSADLVSKIVVVATIEPTDPGVRLLGGAVYLVHARNSGAAFSLAAGATVVLTAISLIVIAVVIRAARRLTSTGWALALGLVLGGAMGNLADRLFRAPSPGKGHVVDWISVLANDGHVWPIFNLADSAIMTGGALAVLLSLRGVEFSSGRGRRAEDEPVTPPQDEPADEPVTLPRARPVDKPADEPVAAPQDRAAESRPHD